MVLQCDAAALQLIQTVADLIAAWDALTHVLICWHCAMTQQTSVSP